MSDISKINVDGVDYDVKDVTARTEVTPIERGGTGANNKQSARAKISVVPWIIVTSDTFDTFWETMLNECNQFVGCCAFRIKDTTGWMGKGDANLWYNGLAFWQNLPTAPNVAGTILARADGDTYISLYKGVVNGNSTDGYTVSWSVIQETAV